MGRGGAIVNLSSSSAKLATTTEAAVYASSKTAVLSITRSFAYAFAPSGVRVNAICPGIIDTPMFRGSWAGAPDPQAELARILDRYLIKRAGQPDEIALAALYLTSDESSFVTGAALAVDGGRTFH